MKQKKLTHFDEKGAAKMVDIAHKDKTVRKACAKGIILMKEETLNVVNLTSAEKGDVLGIARIAGIMGAKKTSELIPLCHAVPISKISIDFFPVKGAIGLEIVANVKTNAQTGVEMEALTAVSISSLTIYDMLKSIDKEIKISGIFLYSKSGGKSGTFKNSRLRS
tara:strand:+ start:765 stop:1259 length:495 start_codon:yes stop_codon:yes gene_type:complete